MPAGAQQDDLDDEPETALLNSGKATISPAARWPWVLLGLFLGLLAVLGTPNGASMGGVSGDTSCGAVPSAAPPLVRRSLTSHARNVLVTGGAGFIASHFALALIDRKGFNVTVVDDLSRGSIETILRLQALAEAAGEPLNWERLDVNEEHKMAALLQRNNIDTVVHFSGNAYVGESMVYPEAYYQNITVRMSRTHTLSLFVRSDQCRPDPPVDWRRLARTPPRRRSAQRTFVLRGLAVVRTHPTSRPNDPVCHRRRRPSRSCAR
jgi:hypothetical protein